MQNRAAVTLIVLVPLLLVGFMVVAPFGLITLSSLPVTTSGWSIYDQETTLTVAGVSGTGTGGQIEVDPDGATWVYLKLIPYPGPGGVLADIMPLYTGKPTIHTGVSASLALPNPTPQVSGDWDIYRFTMGLDFKTVAQRPVTNPVSFESTEVTAVADFNIGLQKGALAGAAPQAKIMDVTVADYKSGITADLTKGWGDVQYLFNGNYDPTKCVLPRVTTITQAGESCIKTIDANRTLAGCKISVALLAGGYCQWSSTWGVNYISQVTVYDVYAVYSLAIDVAVKHGSPPPDTNPWLILLQMLEDFVFNVRDAVVNYATLLGLIGIIIVALILTISIIFIVVRFGGHRKK